MIEWDVLHGLEFDLTQPGPWAVLRGWLVSGKIKALFMGTPCETLSQARRGGPDARMPRRLRDGTHLFGLPNVSADDQAKLDRGNLLVARAGQVWNLASKFGIPVGEENPGSSWLWQFPDRIRRQASPFFHEAIVDQCAAGRPFRARSKFHFLYCRPSPALLKMKCHGRGLCDFTQQPHLELSGKEKGAVQFRTRQKAAYPDAICAQLASMFSQVIVNKAVSRKWMLMHG